MGKGNDKLILIGYRHPSISTYKLKVNKKRAFGFLAFVGLCLATPFTNWLIPLVWGGISKLNPLFFYR